MADRNRPRARRPRPPDRGARRGLSLAETLAAVVLTAVVMAAALGTVTNWSVPVRAMPQTTGHGSEDAQIQQMVAELRSAYQLAYLYTYPAVGAALENCTVSSDTRGTDGSSDSQIAVDASTSANYAAPPAVICPATRTPSESEAADYRRIHFIYIFVPSDLPFRTGSDPSRDSDPAADSASI